MNLNLHLSNDLIATKARDRITDFLTAYTENSNSYLYPVMLKGSWGVGKSTTLSLLADEYIKRNECLVVYYSGKNDNVQWMKNLESQSATILAVKKIIDDVPVEPLPTRKKLYLKAYNDLIGDDVFAAYESCATLRAIIPIIIFVDRWDLLPKDHPFYTIPEPRSSVEVLYVVAGSGSWDPIRSERRFEEIYKMANSNAKVDYMVVGMNPLKLDKMKKSIKPLTKSKFTMQELFDMTGGILRFINTAIVLQSKEQVDKAIQNHCRTSVYHFLDRIKDLSTTTTKSILSRVLLSSFDPQVSYSEYLEHAGLVDTNGKYLHPEYENAIRSLYRDENTIKLLIECCESCGLSNNGRVMGFVLEQAFLVDAETNQSLELHSAARQGRKSFKVDNKYLVKFDNFTVSWNGIIHLKTRKDLDTIINYPDQIIYMYNNSMLSDFLWFNSERILVFQMSISSYDNHRNGCDAQDLYTQKSDEFNGLSLADRLKQILPNRFVEFVYVSPAQPRSKIKKLFYVPKNDSLQKSFLTMMDIYSIYNLK